MRLQFWLLPVQSITSLEPMWRMIHGNGITLQEKIAMHGSLLHKYTSLAAE